MTSDEIVSKFKEIPIKKRLLIVGFLAIIPSSLELFEAGQILHEDLATEQQSFDSASAKFEKALQKKKKLPEMETRLTAIKDEMSKARAALPDIFLLDKILEKTSILAEEHEVELLLFDPGKETLSKTAFKYVELPIKLELSGSFADILSFFDRIVHLDLLVHIRDYNMVVHAKPVNASLPGDDMSSLSIEEKQELERKTTKILTSCQMVVFRTLSDNESEAIDKTKTIQKGKKGKKA